MYNCAVLGDAESVKGFAALGFAVYPCEPEDAPATLRRLLAADSPCGVIFITEDLCELLEREIAAADSRLLPAIVPLPGVRGGTGFGRERVHRAVERAVGSDSILE